MLALGGLWVICDRGSLAGRVGSLSRPQLSGPTGFGGVPWSVSFWTRTGKEQVQEAWSTRPSVGWWQGSARAARSIAGKRGWEPITARCFSRGTQESLPSLLLNMQSSGEIILAKNTSHTPSPHRLSSLAGAAAVRVEALGLESSLSPPASPGFRLYRARPGRGGSAQACSAPLPFYLPVWAGGYFGTWFVWALLCLFGL